MDRPLSTTTDNRVFEVSFFPFPFLFTLVQFLVIHRPSKSFNTDHYQLNAEVFLVFLKFQARTVCAFPPLFTQNLYLNHSVKACEQGLIHTNIVQNQHTQFQIIIICNKDHFSVKYTPKQNLMLI